ncbi:protein kinase domain-containing protein, partial [Haematococcus lacustris]
PSILPLVLVCLIGFAAHKEHAGLITHTAALDLLCRIVHQYDLLFKRLAADLLALLARREEVIAELLAMNGLGRLVGQLPSGDPALTQSLLRVVCYLASDSAALTEIYQTGTIPVLLSLIASALKDWPSPGSNPALTSSKVIDMQLVCTALTRIAEDNELAYNIRQCNGITLLGKLLLLPGTSHGPQTDS